MREENKWRTKNGSSVIFIDEGISLIEPVLICVVLYFLEGVTKQKMGEKKETKITKDIRPRKKCVVQVT